MQLSRLFQIFKMEWFFFICIQQTGQRMEWPF